MSEVTLDRHPNGVALLTLNLPERRNAMTAAVTAAWVEQVAAVRADRSVRAVVVTGAGTAFCAGGDLSWLGDGSAVTPDAARDRMYPFYRSWLAIRDLEVPVLAAINGAAIGAGLCLALACDLRYATPQAKLAVPFTSLGLHPGMAATYLLPEVVGMARARDLLYTGRVVMGEEAERMGLLTGVVDADRLLDTVLETAATVAAGAPLAVRLLKAALARPPRSVAAALEWEALAQPVTMATADLREGLAAQAGRRAPQFKDR